MTSVNSDAGSNLKKKKAQKSPADSAGSLTQTFPDNTILELKKRISALEKEIEKRQQVIHELEVHSLDVERELTSIIIRLTESNRENEALAFAIGHEFRAPLRSITGYSHALLESHELDVESRKYLISIVESATRMDHLILDLLSFSTIARKEPKKSRVALTSIVRACIRELRLVCGNRKIHWNIAELPEVHVDPTLIRAVFADLIHNALKFSRKRNVTEIEVGYLKRTKDHVFFVKDNGVGFDPRYADRLFGVFQRAHRTEDYEGNGVGLAKARRIILGHGGTIWAESELNCGATFYFSIPID